MGIVIILLIRSYNLLLYKFEAMEIALAVLHSEMNERINETIFHIDHQDIVKKTESEVKNMKELYNGRK